jgi:hypothetical protein
MPGYLIANVKVTDPEGFERYRAGVPGRNRSIWRALRGARRHHGTA